MSEFDVLAATPEQFKEYLQKQHNELIHFDKKSGWYHAQGGRRKGAFGGVFEYKAKKNMRRRYTK